MSANGQLVFTDVDKVTFKGVGNASNAVIDTLTGKIGVGVDSPSANLHVVGNCFVSTNFELGGTMTMGTVTVEAQHELSAITATGNLTPHTIQFTNPTTAFTTTGNVSVGKDLTVTGFVGNSGTGAILVPSGTTAQQPAGVNGMLRYNTETGYMEAYTVSGWSVIATPPSITSFDITNVAVAAVDTDTITVSGSGFDAITNIQLRGVDGKNYDTTTFTFTNSGSIGFKIGTLATGQLANRPYKVVATNGAGLSATSSTTLGLGGVTWSSPVASSINDFPIGVSTSLTLSAYDGGGGSAVTYTLQSGSYLSGTFTLSGSTITGTTDAAENTTSSVTIRATDNADSSVFLDRTFTLKAVPDGLYAFTSHTFTPAGATGRGGPTLTEARNAYTISVPPSPATPWDEDTNLFNILTTEKGIQRWTVPVTGSYTIDAYGARGAFEVGMTAGKGARIKGTFNLTKNQVIKIAVGQEGWTGSGAQRNKPGGGGGTFVWINDPPNNPLIVAGGGGGVRVNFSTDADGQSGTNAGEASVTISERRGYPGQVVGVGHGSWVNGSGYACSGGGAGWLSEGHDGSNANSTAYAGTLGSYWKQSTSTCCYMGQFGRDLRLAAGMTSGSTTVPSTEKLYGGFQGCNTAETNSVGGFGGGGGGGGSGEGGGGGYSGGAGTYASHNHGGGGGSYNGGSSQTNTAGSMNGNGSCIITYNP